MLWGLDLAQSEGGCRLPWGAVCWGVVGEPHAWAGGAHGAPTVQGAHALGCLAMSHGGVPGVVTAVCHVGLLGVPRGVLGVP